MIKRQTCVVLGSNSFSGACFVDHLLQQGYDVLGCSRSSECNSVFLPYKWQDRPGKFSFHQHDINHDIDGLVRLIRKHEAPYVINFAAQSMVAESWRAPADWFMTNAVSTVKLHDELRRCDFIQRYVHISTPEVYGNCSGFVDESTRFNPSTPYAVSRAAGDMSLQSFHAGYNFPVVTTRAANVYGPGQQLYRIIPRTILFILLGKKLQLHGGGVSRRSFIHMDDVSDATLKVMLHGKNGDTYHISTNEVVSIRELVEILCTKLGVLFDDHAEVVGERLGKDAAYQLDSTKLRTELGWQDKLTLDQGLDKCIDWVKRNLDVLKNQPFDYVHKP
ncbi:MAG: GDP-mannose 4,6-dehydratase [Polynucleobacter sp.]|uniref:GDP-mannose 4,6-dehydratase n=1 Tax=Polynucleobacter sp. TaxID=2029855 RepID=UPI00271ED8AE|nr:GDP-mannose 4,6-dehydratase [Polynucleobacter sp.]MDO8713783.1 GDP-mannose 4,6-dehydratase [Polynucleobacter sp.]